MTKREKIPVTLPTYTLGEELCNSISHGVGVVLSVLGCIIAIVFAAMYGNVWGVVSSSIYGATLIITYTTSTMYHALTNRTAKKVFRILDHTTIFLLIAGTYTPLTLITLRGPIGWTVFGVVWGAAVLGIVLNAVSLEKFKKFSMIAYIASGWAAIFAIVSLYRALDTRGFWLLIGGGLFYTVGIIFFSLKNIKYMHSIWHMFVIGGSVLHYFVILLYVLPVK